MQFRGGMNELMRQAARMQRKIEQAKEAVKDKEVVAGAVGDKVKATVTYARKVTRIEIDPEFLKSEGIEMALDGACAAINSAIEQADKAMEAEVDKVTGGVKVPGLT
ncbi:MAG TPA: YbaB/EbfC family nucleoid-associated protein [Polyangiaceae bacterium]|nr:YbaB/EbfC family nucleoid-associated protein [Polyangiaceae bacterium]